MKVARIVFHALFVVIVNLVCILMGFGLWSALRASVAPLPQVPVQAAAGAALSILVSFLWMVLFPRLCWPAMELRGPREYAGLLLASLLWTPLLFYPLHYLTQGYVAQFSNVLAIWAFQLPVNALALWLAYRAAYNHLAEPDHRQL